MTRKQPKKRAGLKLTKRSVDAAEPAAGKVVYLFDRELTGFGLKITPNGHKIYFVQGRIGKGRNALKMRDTIGKHGSPWTPDTARDEARRRLGDIVRGHDPREVRKADRAAITMADLCQRYLAKAEAGELLTRTGRPKRASTLATDRGRIERHLIPLLGKKLVKDLTKQEVQAFVVAVSAGKTAVEIRRKADSDKPPKPELGVVYSEGIKPRGKAVVRGGAGTAARTLGLLGGIMSFAVDLGLRNDNPVTRDVKRAKARKRHRFLDGDEFRRLGEALVAAEKQGVNRKALAAIRLLALTGARRGEVLTLRQEWIDGERHIVTYDNSKTGESIRPIGRAALDLIMSLSKKDETYVLPATSRGKHAADRSKAFVGLPKIFRKVVAMAGLKGVTPHTLRHSFATVANDLGYAESTIAAMLGHARHTVTSRYAHVIDTTLVAAADRVAAHIKSMLDGEAAQSAHVIELWIGAQP